MILLLAFAGGFLFEKRGDFLIVFMKHAGDVDDMIFADEMDAKTHSTK